MKTFSHRDELRIGYIGTTMSSRLGKITQNELWWALKPARDVCAYRGDTWCDRVEIYDTMGRTNGYGPVITVVADNYTGDGTLG